MSGPTPSSRQQMGGSASSMDVDSSVVTDIVVARDVGKREACQGCGRFPQSPSFLDPEQPTAWALPGDRGAWCSNCHTCWRTNFLHVQGSQSQALFASWLLKPENRQLWTKKLFSFLTLLRENHSKVTKVMVDQRCDTLDWLFGFIGLPFGSPLVVQVVSGQPTCPADGDCLMQVLDASGGATAGVVRLADISKPIVEGSTLLARHAPSTARWPASLSLQVTRGSDMELLKSLLAFSAAAPSWAASSTTSGSSASGKKASKAELLAENVRQAFAATFSLPSWTTLAKVAQFTPFTKKFLEVREAASSSGDGVAEDICNVWLSGMSSGKAFVGAYKLWSKNGKHEQFMLTYPACAEWVSFLREERIEVHCSLATFADKVRYLHHAAEEKTLAPVTKQFFSDGVFSLLRCKADSDQPIVPEVWLRNLCIHALVLVLQGMTLEQIEEPSVRKGICSDVEATADVIASFDGYDFSAIADGLKNFTTVLKVGLGDGQISAADAKTALQSVMSHNKFPKLAAFLEQEPIGQQIIESTRELLTRRASDDIAASKLLRGKECLLHPAMTRIIQRTESESDLVNPMRVVDQVAIQVFGETLSFVTQALEMFSSPVQLDEHMGLLNEWSKSFAKGLASCHHAVVVALSAPAMETLELLIEGDPEGDAVDLFTEAMPHLTKLNQCLARVRGSWMPGEWATLQVAGVAFMESKGASVGPVVKEVLRECFGHLQRMIVWRQRVLEFLDALILFRNVAYPTDEELAVDEWLAAQNSEQQKITFLELALELQVAAGKVEPFTCPWMFPDESATLTVKPDDGDAYSVEWQASLLVLSKLTSCAFVKIVAGSLESQASHLVTKLVGSLQCTAWRGATEVDIEAAILRKDHITTMLDLIVDHRTLGYAIRAFKTVLMDSKQNMPAVALASIVGEILADHSTSQACRSSLVSCPALYRAGDVPETDGFSSEMLAHLLEAYGIVHEVLVAFAFMRTTAFAEDASCVAGHKVRPELSNAVSFLVQGVDRLAKHLSHERFLGVVALRLPCVIPPERLLEWSKAASSVIPLVKKAVVTCIVENSYDLAQRVTKLTPQYAHIAGPKDYHPKLSKKHLAGYSGKDQLSEGSVMLCQALMHATELHRAWGMSPPLSDDPDYSEQLKSANSAYQEAKKALVVIAAATILECSAREDARKQQASSILSRKKQLPTSMVVALERIVGASSGGAAGKGTLAIEDA